MRHGKPDIYDAVSNPVRREIVILLGEHGALRAKDLKDLLNIGPGQLYYHLNLLHDLVTQNEKKEYVLTDLGREVYVALTKGDVPSIPEATVARGKNPALRLFGYLIFPKPFFNYIFESPSRHLIEAFLIILVGGYVGYLSGYATILIIPIRLPLLLSHSYIYLLGSILSTFLLSDILSFVLFKRSKGRLELFLGTIISYLPIVLFYVVIYLWKLYGFNIRELMGGWIIKVFLVICQVYVVTLLSSSISSGKELRIDKAALISLSIAYLYIVVYITLFAKF